LEAIAGHVAPILNARLQRKRDEKRIQQQRDELTRWQALMLGHEDRNMQLKREVNELFRRLGEPIRYLSQTEASAGNPEA
jgi:hypothetical protein